MDGTFSTEDAVTMAPVISGGTDEGSSELAAAALDGIVGIATGNLLRIRPVAIKFGAFDVGLMEKIVKVLDKMRTMLAKEALDGAGGVGNQIDSSLKALLSGDKMDLQTTFTKYDRDHSGCLDFDEVFECFKITIYPREITENKAMKIFVKADTNSSGSLDLGQFQHSIQILEEDDTSRGLEMLGLAPKQVGIIIAVMTGIMLALFVFIFNGIWAFSTPGGFSASINTSFPLMAGGGASKSAGDGPASGDELEHKIEDKLDQMAELDAS
jgi:hypothetical protein